MSFYVRYESDGTTYNDDNLDDDILSYVTSYLDDILPSTSVSYNDVTVTKETITIDGVYEEVDTFVPLNEELLGIDNFPSTRYVHTLSR
jgi:hypothetical protein